MTNDWPAGNVPKVYAAIVAVQDALSKTGISKDRVNKQQDYHFRGIDDVYAALAPLLAKHKLCILPRAEDRTVQERPTKSGGLSFYVTLKVTFDLVSAEDGSVHAVSSYGEAMDTGDKATNKAYSTAYKIAAFAVFCIPTEGDNDTEENTTHEVVPRMTEKQIADHKAAIDGAHGVAEKKAATKTALTAALNDPAAYEQIKAHALAVSQREMATQA